MQPPWQTHSGILKSVVQDRYGFILRPDGTQIFVIPTACAQFGFQLPPVGTKVIFKVVKDERTGRPRADDVKTESESGDNQSRPTTIGDFVWQHGLLEQSPTTLRALGQEKCSRVFKELAPLPTAKVSTYTAFSSFITKMFGPQSSEGDWICSSASRHARVRFSDSPAAVGVIDLEDSECGSHEL